MQRMWWGNTTQCNTHTQRVGDDYAYDHSFEHRRSDVSEATGRVK